MRVFALIADEAVADYIVIDRDTLGFEYGRRQNHVIVCIRLLANRAAEGR